MVTYYAGAFECCSFHSSLPRLNLARCWHCFWVVLPITQPTTCPTLTCLIQETQRRLALKSKPEQSLTYYLVPIVTWFHLFLCEESFHIKILKHSVNVLYRWFPWLELLGYFSRAFYEKETRDNCLYLTGNHRDEIPPDQSMKVINSLQITVVELKHKDTWLHSWLSSQGKKISGES